MKPRSKRRFQNLNLRLTFTENYVLTETLLGSGSYGEVRICKSRSDNQNEEGKEFAVKIVKESSVFFSRVRVLREIETFYICREHENIIQFLHFYEEPLGFYLCLRKLRAEASQIVLELAKALSFLHQKGIAHRDLKAENVLCVRVDSPCPVKLEVLETFSPTEETTDEFSWPTYDKKCDLWSLGKPGWDEGEACSDCQRNLKSSIRKGVVDFSETNWTKVSSNAVDLVSKLLIKDPVQRLSAQDLLIHPWITGQGSNNSLITPSILRRNSSLKDLTTFTSTANTLRRAISAYNRSSLNELHSKQKKNSFMFSSIDEDKIL
ncbi:MKNK [Lepeophtheirus salmonis]|uniref:MKNK n=1 Tax=Lepeophtheirus salmonis TaxID=72036 RepID=A0A7R8CHP2_LEPSM|nr:MKNK [Lepeophtheirus salmonis]CAF2793046.1 MKNK [Lepeophtheirus salmonis]